MIQLPRDIGNAVNDNKNTAFDEPIFFGTSHSYYYLPVDSDILENIVDLIHKEVSGIYLGFVICSTQKGPLTVMTVV